MQSTTDDTPSIVRSVRFLPDQWLVITAKCERLGVPVGKFLRNAALAAAGAPTEASNLRKLADTLDNLPSAGAAARAAKPLTKTRKPASVAPARVEVLALGRLLGKSPPAAGKK